MELVKIISSNDPLLKKVPELYESAFPEEERTETERLLRMIEDCPQMTFNAITVNGRFCGMAIIWNLGICRYLLYLATLESKRNKGLGSETLRLLQEESDLPIILEVERPTDHIKASRINFYKRNGFHMECRNPKILNAAHSHAGCILQLMSNQPIQDLEACQNRVVNIVYRGMHEYDQERQSGPQNHFN